MGTDDLWPARNRYIVKNEKGDVIAPISVRSEGLTDAQFEKVQDLCLLGDGEQDETMNNMVWYHNHCFMVLKNGSIDEL